MSTNNLFLGSPTGERAERKNSLMNNGTVSNINNSSSGGGMSSNSNNNLTFTPYQNLESRIEPQELLLDDDDYMLDDEVTTPFYVVPSDFGSATRSRTRTNSGNTKTLINNTLRGNITSASSENTNINSSDNGYGNININPNTKIVNATMTSIRRNKRAYAENLFDSSPTGITRSAGHLNLSLSSRTMSPDIVISSIDLEQKHQSINEKIATWSPFKDYINTNMSSNKASEDLSRETEQDYKNIMMPHPRYTNPDVNVEMSLKRTASNISNPTDYQSPARTLGHETSNNLKKWNNDTSKNRSLKNRNSLALNFTKEENGYNNSLHSDAHNNRDPYAHRKSNTSKIVGGIFNSESFSDYYNRLNSTNPSSGSHQQHTAKIRKKCETENSKLSFINAKPDPAAFTSSGLVSKLQKTASDTGSNNFNNTDNREGYAQIPNTPMKRLPFQQEQQWQKHMFHKPQNSMSSQYTTIQEEYTTQNNQSNDLFSDLNYSSNQTSVFNTSPVKFKNLPSTSNRIVPRRPASNTNSATKKMNRQSTMLNNNELSHTLQKFTDELYGTTKNVTDSLFDDKSPIRTPTKRINKTKSFVQSQQQTGLLPPVLKGPLHSPFQHHSSVQNDLNAANGFYNEQPNSANIQRGGSGFKNQGEYVGNNMSQDDDEPMSLDTNSAGTFMKHSAGSSMSVNVSNRSDSSGGMYNYSHDEESEDSYLLTKFANVELLGQGSFSKVYRVTDQKNMNTFAVKCLVPKNTMKQIVLNEIGVLQYIQETKEKIEHAKTTNFGSNSTKHNTAKANINSMFLENGTRVLNTFNMNRADVGNSLESHGIPQSSRSSSTTLNINNPQDDEFVNRDEMQHVRGASGSGLKQLNMSTCDFDDGKEFIFDFITSWKHSSCFFIMSEYYENGTLDDFIQTNIIAKKKRLEDWRIWKIIVEVCQGLRFLHETCRIVHLDIKPCNIFVTFEGSLKIGDFGMSTRLPIMNKAFENEGDREYIAPEIISDGIYDFKADIFSLGLMIVEIACNVMLPDNGAAWHKLRSGDLTDAGRLSSTDVSSVLSGTKSSAVFSMLSNNQKLSKITQLSSASKYIESNKLTELETKTGTKVPAWVPKFLIDGESLDSMVKWMIEPDHSQRPSADEILKTEECEYVEMTKKCGATIQEDDFGPKPEFF